MSYTISILLHNETLYLNQFNTTFNQNPSLHGNQAARVKVQLDPKRRCIIYA